MASKGQRLTSLLDIQSTTFAEQYELGSWWSMHGDEQGEGPLSIRYLKTNLARYNQQHYFEQQDPYWRHHIGFYIGMYHGGVFSPETNKLRPEVTTLILLDHRQATHGYHVGREAFFHQPGPEYRYCEQTLIERLQEIVSDAPRWKEPERTWNYELGYVLGELSGPLFPETQEEEQAWRAQCHKWGTERVQEAKVLQRRAILQEA